MKFPSLHSGKSEKNTSKYHLMISRMLSDCPRESVTRKESLAVYVIINAFKYKITSPTYFNNTTSL